MHLVKRSIGGSDHVDLVGFASLVGAHVEHLRKLGKVFPPDLSDDRGEWFNVKRVEAARLALADAGHPVPMIRLGDREVPAICYR